MIVRFLILFFLIWNAAVATVDLSINIVAKRDAAVEVLSFYGRFFR